MTIERPVVEFDHISEDFAQRRLDVYRELRSGCPVAFSPHYGGYWVLTRYEDVRAAARDYETFTSTHGPGPDGTSYDGIVIPPVVGHGGMSETDPPEWNPIRRALTPMFAPGAVERLRPRVLEYTTACLDRCIESGRMDLVEDLATPVPALVTMELLGLPLDLWQWCAHASHRLSYALAAEAGEAWADFVAMLDAVGEAVKALRVRPQGGIIARLLAEGIDGEPVSDDDLRNMCQGLIVGGVDTTGSLTSQALLYLHRHPEARQRLIDDPSMIPVATEEFLRHFTPNTALARTVTRDTELGGQQMKAGDRVLLIWDGANHDPGEFESPDTIVLDRFPNRHIAFGVGLHRCIGSNLARSEFTAILGEVLRRIPDFEIDESASESYPSIKLMQGYIAMPATFTPGRREGSVDLPAPRSH